MAKKPIPKAKSTDPAPDAGAVKFIPALVPDDKLYAHCFMGYQYRDQLIPQEFSYMSQTFTFLLALMAAARSIEPEWVGRSFAGIIGVAGLCALSAYALDLHANATCKGRLRRKMIQMERGIITADYVQSNELNKNRVGYWHFIAHRSRSLLERAARELSGHDWDPSATRGFMFAAYIYLAAWIVIAVVSVTYDIKVFG